MLKSFKLLLSKNTEKRYCLYVSIQFQFCGYDIYPFQISSSSSGDQWQIKVEALLSKDKLEVELMPMQCLIPMPKQNSAGSRICSSPLESSNPKRLSSIVFILLNSSNYQRGRQLERKAFKLSLNQLRFILQCFNYYFISISNSIIYSELQSKILFNEEVISREISHSFQTQLLKDCYELTPSYYYNCFPNIFKQLFCWFELLIQFKGVIFQGKFQLLLLEQALFIYKIQLFQSQLLHEFSWVSDTMLKKEEHFILV
ncbi:hypothetical protein TTHERM_000079949 (macronuclear) [Tetrahymena thermophila SB210]|uniref:Uncharacterized protein n=1 Tax=Tetrahymena thermophila (strain SB210) TaxID=312017 RepID=W7XAT7_TETTS|nr:hypothetical protein TTHERM_000079949 [Tetrahymena thermophila SB210]EWS74467.1 hypothetical protein TTHERM_000079949 [Tetrahymena thermophila SB210]|eukprot:XP_012653044.1 hypothetical protein TTHERM_000079949 [Tetrahymena thermophila SB210]